jgi:hypothetical protein
VKGVKVMNNFLVLKEEAKVTANQAKTELIILIIGTLHLIRIVNYTIYTLKRQKYSDSICVSS